MSTSAAAFGLAVVAWGTAFAKSWERRSVWYQLEWGMDDDHMNEAEAAPDRANFRGVRRRNPITQQWETHFPGHIRLQRQIASALLIVCAGGAHLLVCLLLLLAQGLLAPWLGLRLAVGGSCLAIALLMLWNGDAISALAHRLSEWENYQSERDFQCGVIAKVSALQFFNAYGPLLLVAFGLYHTTDQNALPLLSGGINAFHTHIAPYVSVIVELQLLLALVFATRITSHVLLMAHGLLQESLRASSASDSPSPPSVESELALQAYRGSYEDYTEIVVQLGLVAMFSGIFPLAPLLAFAECALELRLDALDLCLFLQRPTPDPAGGIGPWTSCVRGVLALGAVVNLALLYFAADNYADWSGVRRVGAFLASALVAYIVAELVWLLVPSHSRLMQQVRARHAFLVERYFGGGGGEDSTQKEKAGDNSMLREAERRALESTGDGDDGDGDEEDAEAAPGHYHERLALLRRLNTALRRRDESLEPETAEATAPPVEEEQEEEEEEGGGDEEEEEERAVVGYFVRGVPPSQPAASEILLAAEEADATPIRTVEPHARTALAGLTAIHAATERQRFDFAQDSGWQQQDQQQAEQGARRGSASQSLSQRFSYFRKRRASTDDAELPPSTGSAPAAATTATPVKASAAPTKRRGSISKITARQTTAAKKAKPTRSREGSDAGLPVVQLSGLEAVHEAARRDQLDFSTDPWRAREDAAAP